MNISKSILIISCSVCAISLSKSAESTPQHHIIAPISHPMVGAASAFTNQGSLAHSAQASGNFTAPTPPAPDPTGDVVQLRHAFHSDGGRHLILDDQTIQSLITNYGFTESYIPSTQVLLLTDPVTGHTIHIPMNSDNLFSPTSPNPSARYYAY